MMEPPTLINEAHFLERKSEQAACKGRFDDAIDCCVAASDCLSRLLNDDDGGYSGGLQTRQLPLPVPKSVPLVDGQVRESLLAQLSHLETRQRQLTKKKRQYDFLKDILTLQRDEREKRRKAANAAAASTKEEEEQRCRRGSSVKRRLSNKGGDNRRRSGYVEAVVNRPPREELEKQTTEGDVDVKKESFSSLRNYLDGRVGDGDRVIDGGRVDGGMEEMRYRNAQLEHRVASLLQTVEMEKTKSAALEASLYEMSMNPPREDGGGRRERRALGGGRLGDGVGGGGDGDGRRELIHRLGFIDGSCSGETVAHHSGDGDDVLGNKRGNHKHSLRLNLPPLDLPPMDLPPLELSPLEIPHFTPSNRLVAEVSRLDALKIE